MDVKHVAKLASLPFTDDQIAKQEEGLQGVMALVDHVQKIDTTGVEPTAQVTGQVNVTRPDVIDTSRMFTQEQALSNAADASNGYFRVKAIFNE